MNMKGCLKMENDKLYIVLTQTYSILAKTIKLITKDTYSHASLSFDKKCNEMYSFGRKYRYFPFYGIFKKENLKEGLFKNKGSLIAIYEINVTENQFDEAKKRVGQIKNNNKGYNIIGLLLAKFRIKLNRSKYYCSEFVYDVLSYKDVNLINDKDVRFKPEELIKGLNGKKIFEGEIREFINTI